MSTQERLTMSQILKITPNGTSEIVTNDAVIQPGQHSFANQEALYAYLVQTFGAKVQNGGMTGSFARTGKYERRSADGAPAITFGNPILDTISSAEGSLVINDRIVDLLPLRSSINMPGRTSGLSDGVVTFDAPALKRMGTVHDAEKWVLDDGSYVEYRIGNGRLGFQAWRNGPSISDLGFWDMGVGIWVWNTATNYEAAFINALSFISATAPCQTKQFGGTTISDYSGTHVELNDWGFNAQQPERVAGVCMAQWHHRQFADLVTAGSGCPDYMQNFMNPTFPEDWNPIPTDVNLNGNWTDGSARNAVISVSRRSFSIDMSAFGRPTANGTIDGFTNITAIFPDDRTYKGQLQGNAIRWSNGSQWTKVVNTVFDLNGTWSDGGLWVAVIFAGPTSLTVDMSDFDRPTAYGEIIDSSTITVTFPDDLAYTGTLIEQGALGTIRWSNGSTWTKKG
jgi:hypothetical protein